MLPGILLYSRGILNKSRTQDMNHWSLRLDNISLTIITILLTDISCAVKRNC